MCFPWKASYLLVSLVVGSPFKDGGLFGQGLYWDGKLRVNLICWGTSFKLQLVLSPMVPIACFITLMCFHRWLVGLLDRLFGYDSIVIPKHIAFCNNKDLCQRLAGSYGQLAV